MIAGERCTVGDRGDLRSAEGVVDTRTTRADAPDAFSGLLKFWPIASSVGTTDRMVPGRVEDCSTGTEGFRKFTDGPIRLVSEAHARRRRNR